jgi:hypothetical protein
VGRKHRIRFDLDPVLTTFNLAATSGSRPQSIQPNNLGILVSSIFPLADIIMG